MVFGVTAFLGISSLLALVLGGVVVIGVAVAVVVAAVRKSSGSEGEVAALRAEVQRLREENERLRDGSA